MTKTLRLLLIITLIGIIGCSEESPLGFSDDQADGLIVVQAYVYANEPITDIRITGTLPLGSEELIAPPINDAVVTLLKNGNQYHLEPSLGDSGYYHYDGEDISLQTGDFLTIEVRHSGETITAETTVPPAPEGLYLSNDAVVIPDFTDFFGFRNLLNEDLQMTIRWTKEADALYFVTINNVEADPDSIVLGLPFRPRFNLRSRPTPNDSLQVNFLNFTHLGRHRVKVYRINQEYADLFLTSSQDSRDLNEPLSNIVNGLGVFSAFNSDSLFFDVRFD